MNPSSASIYSMGVLLVALSPVSQGEPVHERTQGPCYSVKVQNERVNDARVEQSCTMNFSRTAQAGIENRSETIQTGEVNSNRVRQYQYNPPRHSTRLHRSRGRGG
jgi:hypothetical protein